MVHTQVRRTLQTNHPNKEAHSDTCFFLQIYLLRVALEISHTLLEVMLRLQI